MILLINSNILCAQEDIYVGKNGNRIIWQNSLPGSFPKIDSIINLGTRIENYEKENGLPNGIITTHLENRNLIIKFETSDNNILTRIYNSENNLLILASCQQYMLFMNRWFFGKIEELNPELPDIFSDLRALNVEYIFQINQNNNYLQIPGGLSIYNDGFGYLNNMMIKEPLIMKYEKYSGNVYSSRPISKNYFNFYLDKAYNSITQEYYSYYLVYLFFGDKSKLDGVPELR
jgi:hypothetical protein